MVSSTKPLLITSKSRDGNTRDFWTFEGQSAKRPHESHPPRPHHGRSTTRVHFSDRTGLTAGLRYRFTGPVRPVTSRNRTNANLNSNFAVVAVVTGKPAGYTGLPAGFAGIPAGCASRFLAVYRPGIPVYRPVLPVYRLFVAFFRRLKNGSPV